MTVHRLRYVGVEYRGGPKDGDRDVMLWPPLQDVRFPAWEPPSLGPLLEACGLTPPECRCHRYAATDVQHCEPFEVSELQLITARDPRLILEDLAEERRPFVYTWQGAE